MEGSLELRTIVSLDDLDLEGEPFEQVVEELDGGLLVTSRIGPQHPDPGAVVDGGELVVLLAPRAADGLDELHVDLDPLARELLLVALVALLVALVALRGRESRHPELVEDPPDARRADPDVVVALEVHGDLVRARSGSCFAGRRFERPPRVWSPLGCSGALRTHPATLLRRALHSGGATCRSTAGLSRSSGRSRRHVSRDLLGVTDDRQAVLDLALLLPIVHEALLSEGHHVNNLRRFTT